jgi:hypothetical protein
MASTTAPQVFNITELAEAILLHADDLQLQTTLLRVSKQIRDVITGSVKLQRRLHNPKHPRWDHPTISPAPISTTMLSWQPLASKMADSHTKTNQKSHHNGSRTHTNATCTSKQKVSTGPATQLQPTASLSAACCSANPPLSPSTRCASLRPTTAHAPRWVASKIQTASPAASCSIMSKLKRRSQVRSACP